MLTSVKLIFFTDFRADLAALSGFSVTCGLVFDCEWIGIKVKLSQWQIYTHIK